MTKQLYSWVAFDPSLSSTGVCTVSMNRKHTFSHTINHETKGVNHLLIANDIYSFVKKTYCHNKDGLYIVEGLFVGKGKAIDVIDAGMAVRFAILQSGCRLLEVSPMTWKSVGLGVTMFKKHTKEGKALVQSIVKQKYNKEFSTMDECDAFLMVATVNTILKGNKYKNKKVCVERLLRGESKWEKI